MTINKIAISALAASILATASFAGKLDNNSSVTTIGKEKLSLMDINQTGILFKVKYTPTDIPAGAQKNPVVKFVFTGLKNIEAVSGTNLSDIKLYDTNGTLVANDPFISNDGGTNNAISFKAVNTDVYLYNGHSYEINATSSSTGLQGLLVKGTKTDVTVRAETYAGDTQQKNDSTLDTTIYKVKNEYEASIAHEFDAKIDAAAGFLKFITGNLPSQTSDTLKISLTRRNVTADSALAHPQAALVIFQDTNLTKNAYSVNATYNSSAISPINLEDLNSSMVADLLGSSTSDAGNDLNVTYSVDGKSKIYKTDFKASLKITTSDSATSFIKLDNVKAGEWTVYGYNAQIPNVASTANVDVTMKFTNRSDIDAEIYFTLIDQDGTIVRLDSEKNPSLAKLPANTTGTYKASTLVSLITDPTFDKTNSFSVEVIIPTTPDKVYGMASFKNLQLGQFKDLPVYNSSSMTY